MDWKFRRFRRRLGYYSFFFWHRERELLGVLALFLLYVGGFYFLVIYIVRFTVGGVTTVAQSLLTVEGLLLGLTPLIYRFRLRRMTVLSAVNALIVSLITIAVSANSANFTSGLATVFYSDVVLFIVMLMLYFVALLETPKKNF